MSINIKDFHEREFHPFLNFYLHKTLGIAAKTIYQEKSTNSIKGENEWIHPDMVGFDLPTSNWNEKVVNMCDNYHIPKVVLYSFELKKEITMSSLREDYFQAVSNSSWSNEGYLVATKIDTDDEKLIQKMNRLCISFGIGIMLLNLNHPEKSEILFEAKRKENIDGEAVNHLFEINQDFKEFLKTVEDSLKINNIVRYKLDELKSKKELEEILNRSQEGENENIDEELPTIESITEIFNWETNVTGKKPIRLTIKDEIFEITSWKDLYVNACNFFSRKDKKKFDDMIKEITGKKSPYFTKNKDELRAPYFLEDSGYFAEVNLSSVLIVNLLKKIVVYFNHSIKDVKIFIEKN